jgi:hypothetical protein
MDHEKQILSISLEMGDCAASDSSFLGNVITGDEIWVYGYDPEFSMEITQFSSCVKSASIKIQQQGNDGVF